MNDVPQVICSECSDTIDNFLEFKSQIMRSDEYFQNSSLSVYKLKSDDKMIKEVDTAPLVDDNDAAVAGSTINLDTCTTNSILNFKSGSPDNITEIIIESSEESETENSVRSISVNESTLPSVSTNDVYSTKSSLIQGYNDNLTLPSSKKGELSESGQKATCSVCGKILLNKRNLKIHMIVHNGVKKFACDFCDRKFLRNYDLTKHKKIHNICAKCNVEFHTKRSLERHLITGRCKNVKKHQSTKSAEVVIDKTFETEEENRLNNSHFTITLL